MDEFAAEKANAGDLELGEIYIHESVGFDSKDVGEVGSTMRVLTRVDLDLACSDKLVNLEKLLIHVLACENDLEAMALASDGSSINVIEKALIFDFLSGFLDSEVRDLANFKDDLQTVTVDARQKISIFGHMTEVFIVMEVKLHDSEELLKQSQEQVLEINLQWAKLQRTPVSF